MGVRARWAAIGAAIATAIVVGVGLGGALPFAGALVGGGARPVFVAVSPTRVLDTRTGVGLVGKFLSGSPRSLLLTGAVPTASGSAVVIPPGASGVVLNVTVVSPSGGGFLSVRPDNPSTAPSTSNLNFDASQVVPNAVTVALSTSGADAGKVQLWYQSSAGATTDVLVDVVGYYDDHQHDDLYYRKAQVDDRIADGPETIVATDAVDAALVPSTLVPDSIGGNALDTVFTTTRASRLRVEQFLSANTSCSAYWFVSIDGVIVRSSVRYLPGAASPVPFTLGGITDTPIAAGAHTMTVSKTCFNGTIAGGSANTVSTGLVSYIAG